MAHKQAFNSQLTGRMQNLNYAYGEWVNELSEEDYLAELDRTRNNGRANALPPTS
ncbi:hypothetical protein [Mycobacterium kyogaense]|uniref:hypothetical protein n=1 Tax=Mycobacterium kyogaense TaxID=2212479 RepID=UPI0013C4ED3A|nr:hypothetical protein [Mycobacterium kyogaense]